MISKCGELEIGLEFRCNSFDDCKIFIKGSFKPKIKTQVIEVQGSSVLLLHTNRDISSIQYIVDRKITHGTIIVQVIIAMLLYNWYTTHP